MARGVAPPKRGGIPGTCGRPPRGADSRKKMTVGHAGPRSHMTLGADPAPEGARPGRIARPLSLAGARVYHAGDETDPWRGRPMPIEFVSGDLFENAHGARAFAHGCNCQGSMGAGV